MEAPLKREIRRAMRERLASVTRADQREGSRALFGNLVDWVQMDAFAALLTFCSFGGELDPGLINSHWLQKGRDLCMTRVGDDGTTLEIRQVRTLLAVIAGYRGIPEPDPAVCPVYTPGKIDAVLVPGLAFDLTGTRLGRGKGHYDRLLARLPGATRRIGIAWDWQVKMDEGDLLLREPHDAVMDYICTPTSLIRCQPGRRE